MNGRDLLEAMSFLEDDLVAASEARRKGPGFIRWAALAACIALVFFISLPMMAPKSTMEEAAMDQAAPAESPAMNAFSGSGESALDAPTAMAPETQAACESDTGHDHFCLLVQPEALPDGRFQALVLEVFCQDYSIAAEDIITLELSEDLESVPAEGVWRVFIGSFDPETGEALVLTVVPEAP